MPRTAPAFICLWSVVSLTAPSCHLMPSFLLKASSALPLGASFKRSEPPYLMYFRFPSSTINLCLLFLAFPTALCLNETAPPPVRGKPSRVPRLISHPCCFFSLSPLMEPFCHSDALFIS